MLALLLFSAIVQGGDHIDRLIHRPALVADDRAVSDQTESLVFRFIKH